MSRPSSPRRLADSQCSALLDKHWTLSYQWLTCQLTLQVLLDLTVATPSCLVMSEQQQQQKRGGGVSVARSDICPSDSVSVRKRRPQFMSSDLQRTKLRASYFSRQILGCPPSPADILPPRNSLA